MSVEVKIISEQGVSREPPSVTICENGKIITEIIVKVELKRGADGGFYHCVTFKKK